MRNEYQDQEIFWTVERRLDDERAQWRRWEHVEDFTTPGEADTVRFTLENTEPAYQHRVRQNYGLSDVAEQVDRQYHTKG